jgi:YHS domain-containing protein
MWRLIVFSLLALIMYFMVRSAIRGLLRDKRGRRSVGSAGSPAELVQDPVCGMYLAKEGAYFVQEGERTHFFCSKACRTSYEQKLSSA